MPMALPIVDSTIKIADEHKIDCVIRYDIPRVFDNPAMKTMTVSKDTDSVAFALVNILPLKSTVEKYMIRYRPYLLALLEIFTIAIYYCCVQE